MLRRFALFLTILLAPALCSAQNVIDIYNSNPMPFLDHQQAIVECYHSSKQRPPKRGEYETKEEYKQRVVAASQNTVDCSGLMKRLVVVPVKIRLSYNADTEEFTFKCTPIQEYQVFNENWTFLPSYERAFPHPFFDHLKKSRKFYREGKACDYCSEVNGNRENFNAKLNPLRISTSHFSNQYFTAAWSTLKIKITKCKYSHHSVHIGGGKMDRYWYSSFGHDDFSFKLHAKSPIQQARLLKTRENSLKIYVLIEETYYPYLQKDGKSIMDKRYIRIKNSNRLEASFRVLSVNLVDEETSTVLITYD